MKSELSLDMPESSEMYLETILLLERNNPVVRQVDIARALGFKRPPTVHVAVKNWLNKACAHRRRQQNRVDSPPGTANRRSCFHAP